MRADEYERKDEREERFPPSYTHNFRSLEFGGSAALGEILKGLKRTERKKAGIFSG